MTIEQRKFIESEGSRLSQWESASYMPELGNREPIDVMRRKGINQRKLRGGAKGNHRTVVDVIMPDGTLVEVFRDLTNAD